MNTKEQNCLDKCEGTCIIIDKVPLYLEHRLILRGDSTVNKNDTNLFEEFSRVQKLLSKYQLWHYRNFGPSGDPHRGQGRVLAVLKLQPEISQKELGYLLDMRNQSLGELLSKLEKAGAITREASEEDRRSMNIKLTEHGVQLIEQGRRKPDDVGRIFECMSAEDRAKLSEILERLSGELKKLLGSDEKDEENGTGKSRRHRKGESEPPVGEPEPEAARENVRHHGGERLKKQKEGSEV